MIDCSDSALLETWFPIATSADLPQGHIFHAQLLGQELAVWRADDEFVNVWENRCLHRGVRLTLGTNLGNSLKCRYHGWRYENRSAGCTYIPAHPANAPATRIKNVTYDGMEQSGLVWARLKSTGNQPPAFEISNGAPLVLRSIPVRASAPLVAETLMGYRFAPNGETEVDPQAFDVSIEPLGAFELKGRSRADGDERVVMLFVQPVEQHRAIIHGLLLGAVSRDARLALLVHHNKEMKRIRDTLESNGRSALDTRLSATGPAAAYRQSIAGKFSYGVVS